MASTNSPCAACKIQRRKCTKDCIFAPYFPPDKPMMFHYVQRVYGASNVAKLLHDLSAADRAEAAMSLVYEAEARVRDPVYGCVGLLSFLQHELKQLQSQVHKARKELAKYIGPQAMLPILSAPHSGLTTMHFRRHPPPPLFSNATVPLPSQIGIPAFGQEHIFDAHAQMLAVAKASGDQQVMTQLRFNMINAGGGYEIGSSSSECGCKFVSSPSFDQIDQLPQPVQDHQNPLSLPKSENEEV